MKRIMLAIIAMMLSGCATYSEMQQKSPDMTLRTAKSPQSFVDCALPRMVDMQADAHAIPDQGNVVIVAPIGNRGGDLAATVTASPTDSGSAVYIRAIFKHSANKVAETITSCI